MASPQRPAVDLLGSAAAPVTLATTYGGGATSSAVDVWRQEWAVYSVFCDAVGTATRIDIQIEESSDGSNWAAVQTELVASGVSTLSDYEQRKAVSGTGLVFLARGLVRGASYQRVKIKVDTGTTTTAHVQYTLSGG